MVGQLWINIPTILIILFTIFIFLSMDYGANLGLIIGLLVGWVYWSYSIKKWFRWAAGYGMDLTLLNKWAKRTLLTFWDVKIKK